MQFELAEVPAAITYCHCTTCKRISGGGGTVNVRVRSDAIRILSGDELLRTFQPDEGSAKTFCSVCGANLFGGGWPEAERSSVRVTALDTQLAAVPEKHLFVRSLASWEALPGDGLDRFETRS